MNMPALDEHRPAAAFQFAVSFGEALDVADCCFQEVSGIAAAPATASFQEGGENRFIHQLPKGLGHPSLVLKRGVVPLSASLVGWCRDVLEGGLAVPVRTRQMRVSLLAATGQPLRVWSLDTVFPVTWSVDPLASNKALLAIEKVALNYQSVTRLI